MKIEKIYFDKDTYIWKVKLNLKEFKDEFLKECYEEIELQKNQKADGYLHQYHVKDKVDNYFWERSTSKEILILKKIDTIIQSGINYSEEIYKSAQNNWSIINSDCWINRIRSKPVQPNFYAETRSKKFHTHTGIAHATKSFYPHYTWVYYIQMPNRLRPGTDDGIIYFKSNKGVEYSILPEEDDLIIMPGDMPHFPMNASESTIDRIVLAGNVGFEHLKVTKTLM